jgi:hydrogenase nickel incorporation protein HypB
MCRTCGCSGDGATDHAGVDDSHDEAGPGRGHGDPSPRATGVVMSLEERVLARNDRLAAETRRWLGARGVCAINMMSAPGAGKTTLLERMLGDLRDEVDICVVEGDQATDRDTERVRAAGGRAVQINTGAGCHLDAAAVARALEALAPAAGSMVVIENVGNLVCPALFDLGEGARVVLTAVTDGDDKPLKYPHMFRAADAVLVNKVDLLPHVRFDAERCRAAVRLANPRIPILEISATRGDGLDAWYRWLRRALAGSRATAERP